MDKWNQQAAPNNNSKASDMKWNFEGSEKTVQDKVSGEELHDRKVENELRKENF